MPTSSSCCSDEDAMKIGSDIHVPSKIIIIANKQMLACQESGQDDSVDEHQMIEYDELTMRLQPF